MPEAVPRRLVSAGEGTPDRRVDSCSRRESRSGGFTMQTAKAIPVKEDNESYPYPYPYP
jgi:hypothetical protein